MSNFVEERAINSLLGLAIGDAVGTTLEFQAKDSFEPITDMVGGGPFQLKIGEWTDDTSMALCLADSLIECVGCDAKDQMDRYTAWFENGYNSVTGHCFDIGNTVHAALARYQRSGDPMAGSTAPNSAGNGSLMRLAPVAIFHAHDTINAALATSDIASQTTHAEPRCIDACRVMTWLLHRIFNSETLPRKSVLLDELSHVCSDNHAALDESIELQSDDIRRVVAGSYRNKTRDQIVGTGYVVDALEAVLWCFWHCDAYDEGVLLAANLGDDADTTAAIFGMLGGAYFGINRNDWVEKLAWSNKIRQTAQLLLR